MFFLAAASIFSGVAVSAMEVDDDWGAVPIGHGMLVIDADEGEYNGRQLKLRGDVALEHPVGAILAKQATLLRRSPGKSGKFTHLRLKDDITVFLEESGTFHCARGDLNLSTLRGHFYGDNTQEYVTYTGALDKGDDGTAPVVFKGRHMSLALSDVNSGTGRPLSHRILEITADHNVTVDYDKEFMAAGDHMVYQRHPSHSIDESAPSMPGTIYLRPDPAFGVCQVTSSHGDLVKADEIEINLPLQQVFFDHPKGAVYMSYDRSEQPHDDQRVDFSALTLSWDQNNNLLTLKDNVIFYHKDMGKLRSSGQVQMCQKLTTEGRELAWISSSGGTELDYSDQNGLEHHLICHGEVFVDPEKQYTTLDSPDDVGLITMAQQVFFRDDRGQVYADRVVLDYSMGDGGFTPTKLTITGNVKILNDAPIRPGADENVLQYAIADVVEYIPETQQMCLYAKEGSRVLFYDLVNHMQVSAPAVNIRRDGSTGREAVEGIGDVRFTFADKEMTALTETFNFHHSRT